MDRKGVTMGGIVVLLLLQAGVLPVISQSQYDSLSYSNAPRFSEYGDYGRYFSGSTEEQSVERNQQRDFPLQQPSFFMPFNDKNDHNNNPVTQSGVTSKSDSSLSTTTVSSLIGGEGSYGGLTPPPPLASSSPDLQVNEDSRTKYFSNERHAIVPSSLRELEESYIRSLSASSSPVPPSPDPYGEDREQASTPGVENYSGFIMENRRYTTNGNNNDARTNSGQQPRHQHFVGDWTQNAPITYGIPLLNEQQQGSASKTSREVPYHHHRNGGRMKETEKFFEYSQKNNIVPNFPDFSDRPPIPEEPEDPPGTEDAIEQATRRTPPRILLPTPQTLTGYGLAPPPLPSASSIFDPSFPGPVLEKGFIPSFGPPTKHPFNRPLKETNLNLLLEHENNQLQQLQSHRHLTHIKSIKNNIPTTSAVPVLRPEYPSTDKEENILPDEVSSIDSEDSTEKPREGTVYKHISVHVPAEDLDDDISAPRIVKVAKNPEKHIKVIFIKPPDSRPTKTEVEVPASPQQKTLVYVLSESGGARQPIKLVKPTPLKPAPPQVFFLRYTDPHAVRGHRRPLPSDDRELTSSSSSGSSSTEQRPIKQLSSPADPDAELLRPAPPPVLPTFTSFGRPTSTLANLQTTLTSPTLYSLTSNNFENTNDINDPTNSRFHGGSTAASASPHALLLPNGNNHLTALHYNNANTPPSSTVQPQAQIINNNNKNPFYTPPNYYSALYHLYPPPALTSLPHQNLFPYYTNAANIYQQQNLQSHHPLQRQQFYTLGTSGTSSKLSGGAAEKEQSSSIQGLYTVAPYLKNLPGSINFNSLIQNPDGNNLPRTTRNYAMMTYAPTYMPSASGSAHVPVFTSPAEFIKSLLGDSYKYYNHIGNSNSTIYTTEYYQFVTRPTTTTPSPSPTPQASTRRPTQKQAKHHAIPVIFNLSEHLQNLSNSAAAVPAKQPTQEHQASRQQPFTIVISNGGSSYEIDNNRANFHHNSNSKNNYEHFLLSPINPHLTPSFLTTATPPTTSTTPPPRISWAPSSTLPPAFSLRSPTPKQVINLPILIYEGGTGKNTRFFPNRLTTGGGTPSHLSKLFNNLTNSENNFGREQSSESGSSSSQSDSSSSAEDEDSSQELSAEEGAFFDSARLNRNSTIVYVNHSNSTRSPSSSPSSPTSGKRGKSRASRKRVNPANVKPGRRLRKVRKPHRSKNRNEAEGEISPDTRS